VVDSYWVPGAKQLAMLIDGDNAQPSLLGTMVAEASKYGMLSIRRIYGDWTTTNMNGWKDILNSHAIQPVQQFRNSIGKNATDSAMIIDAMDILYERVVNGFCLVSSDSDFTRLATRIREKGLFVMGIGNRNTPKAFVNACELFVHTENLQQEESPTQPIQGLKAKAAQTATPLDPMPMLRKAVDSCLQEDGWAFLGAVGNHLRQLDSAFDARTYGHKQLGQLFKAYPHEFETKETKVRGGTSNIHVRFKEKDAA
jgi:predicted nuclease of predicted toxin-antitoxin system